MSDYETYRDKAEECLGQAGQERTHSMVASLTSIASVWATLALAEATRENKPIHPGSSSYVGGPR